MKMLFNYLVELLHVHCTLIIIIVLETLYEIDCLRIISWKWILRLSRDNLASMLSCV